MTPTHRRSDDHNAKNRELWQETQRVGTPFYDKFLEAKQIRMAHDYMIDHIKHLRRNAVRAEAMDSDWYEADIERAHLEERFKILRIIEKHIDTYTKINNLPPEKKSFSQREYDNGYIDAMEQIRVVLNEL